MILRNLGTLNDFGFLVMVYDRVDDGDKFSKKSFVLGRLPFHATIKLKIEAKVFFSLIQE